MILLNEKGQIEKAYQLENTAKNSQIYRNFCRNRYYSTNEYDYLLKRTYYETSLLQKDKKTGNEVIIYNIKKHSISDLIIELIFIVGGLILIIRKLKNSFPDNKT